MQTRQPILEQGLDLVSTAGLSGLTFGVLAERAGMSKSGLFAHFRSKEDAQIALLNEAAALADACVVAPAMQAPEGGPRLRALANNWLGWTTKAGLSGGCPIAAALFELDDLDGDVRAHMQTLEGKWRALLRNLVKSAIATDDLKSDLDADQFVWELCGVYLSHHVSRRFLKEPGADRRAHAALNALFERSAP